MNSNFEVHGKGNIASFESDTSAVILDSGIDDGDIKKVINTLRDRNLAIKGILLTHSHSDHSGGAFYAEKKGIMAYAHKTEAALIENGLALGVMLSGFRDPEFASSKYVTPHSCRVMSLDEFQQIPDLPIETVNLHGHTLGHVGYECGGFLYAGDSLFAEEVLEKHPIPYFLDYNGFKEGLNKLEKYTGVIAVSHGGMLENQRKTIAYNREVLSDIEDFIRGRSERGASLDSIISSTMKHFMIRRDKLSYFIDSTTIKSMAFSLYQFEYRDGELFSTSTVLTSSHP